MVMPATTKSSFKDERQLDLKLLQKHISIVHDSIKLVPARSLCTVCSK
jgi:hypothetical protein